MNADTRYENLIRVYLRPLAVEESTSISAFGSRTKLNEEPLSKSLK